MRIAGLIARILLGLIFTVFGANGFLHFIPMQAPPGLMGEFMGVMMKSHYISVVFFFELLGGLLLLSGFYVPLALTILAPIIVNILLTHMLMAPSGLPLGIVTLILWIVVAYQHRAAFAGLFWQKPAGL